MTINLDEIIRALEEATPGPWTYEQNGKRGAWIGNNGSWSALSCGNTDEEATHNAHLIANAPEWLRLLVERVRATDKVVLAAISERDNHHRECQCYFCEAVDAYKKEST